ncbi:M23 family metallopeptidase [Galactobacter caseinivorans]|uniref:Peptidase M23 n=1 Tax=Galactobacter caseinivorans TaxID=2676123 RepID=A0A496PMG7_9MICC|nr:M23 family metallopeptidase [Galactobacter caseinivorans]RKW71728.1 peptidase M23 [Galactobacter caseinivorans]
MTSARLRLSRAVLGTVLISVFGLGLGVAPVQADKLDDQKSQIDKQVENGKEDLEDLNTTLAEAGAKLKKYQDALPAAQRKLTDAQGRVSAAQGQVSVLQKKLSTARASKAKLDAERESTQEEQQQSSQMAGKIAAQAYRQGGVGGNLSMLLSSGGDASDLAGSIEMASRALQSQNQALASLRQKGAEEGNAAARLKSVEEDIASLKKEADAALATQKTARDDAQSAKDEVDKILADTASAQTTLKGKVTSAKKQLDQQKSEQASINQQIKERQERLKREAEERARKAAEEAKKKRAAAAAAAKKKAANAARLAREADKAERAAGVEKENSTPSSEAPSQSSWGLIIPSTGGYISSPYGWRPTPAGTIDYFGTGGYVHAGQDWGYGGQCGAPIKAAAAGKVEYAGSKSTHGIIVSLDHKIVKGRALTTNYNHMSRVAVNVGQRVKQGQTIGYVGSTGNSTGCHLHFETIVDGSYMDPMKLLR